MLDPLITLTAADGTAFTLSRPAFAALERAAGGTADRPRPFPFAELPATAAEAEALAGFIEEGLAGLRGPGGMIDVSSAYAALALAYSDLFAGPAVTALAWFLRRSGGFTVAAEDVPEGPGVPEPSVN